MKPDDLRVLLASLDVVLDETRRLQAELNAKMAKRARHDHEPRDPRRVPRPVLRPPSPAGAPQRRRS